MRKISTLLRHILVSALTAALAVGPAAPSAFAGPTQIGGNGKGTLGPQVSRPDGSSQWTVKVQNGAIIKYSNFDVVEGDNVNFSPDAGASGKIRVLNRVISSAPTRIGGSITEDAGSQIFVYIVNPAGVFFGPASQVNVTALQAAAGQLSDRDFKRGVDHYTNVRGRVDNAGQIGTDQITNAVSLVGGQVSNSGVIHAEGGWIVMAAGRDVLIGRDGQLLRVEGAANAVFNAAAKGVDNTGRLEATADNTDPAHPVKGTVSLGAGDLYGTAIFSNQAIEARKIALSAANRGNVALGGDVKAEELDVTFGGDKTGELRGTDPTGAKQTINANTVSLLATGANGDVKVGNGLAFRTNTGTDGAMTVNVEQKKALHTTNLKGLDLGDTNRENVQLNLEATKDQLVVDDRTAVTGTKLDLTGLRVIDIRGKDPLTVDTLKLDASATLTDASLIATGTDLRDADGNLVKSAIDATGNIGIFSNPAQVKDPSLGAVLSAKNGSITVGSDITTSDGGSLLLEAKNIHLGSFNPDTNSQFGGVIDASGSIPSRVEIRQTSTDAKDGVELNGINTQGRKKDEKAKPVPGGDVVVNATGDVTVHGAIGTTGEASGKGSVPRLAGGSVHIATSGPTSTLSVGSITTGGADAPVGSAPERGAISLSASKVVVAGNLDAHAGSVANDAGQRDRSVTVDGNLELGGNDIRLLGGDVGVTGTTTAHPLSDPNATPLAPAFTIGASGTTTLGGAVTVDSLRVDSRGKDVIFEGDVKAKSSVAVTFGTAGTGVWRTASDSESVNVQSNAISVTAANLGDPKGATAKASIGPGLHFTLGRADDPATTDVNESSKGSFQLDQDAALDDASLDALFTPGRFSVLAPTPGDPAVAGLGGAAVTLLSHDLVSLDANSRTSLAGSNLTITGGSFAAPVGPSETIASLDLASLDLATNGDLDADFDVTAQKSIALRAGAGGTGDLTVRRHLDADSVTLQAGDGAGGTPSSVVGFGPDARLRDSHGQNSKQVILSQDADLATSSLPDAVTFSDATGPTPLAGLDLQLESRDGTVTLSPGAEATAKIAGTNLTLTGQRGIVLGDSVPLLASLTASTPEALDVATAIRTSAGGKIALHSGATDGIGDLSIESILAADSIDLVAGSGNGSDSKARVVLNDGAKLESASSATLAPKHFGLEQDAAIGGTSGTAIPGAALFGGPIAGMELALDSKGATVTVADPAQVAGTALQLSGTRGVTVSGDLDVASLATAGATTLHGNVASAGDVTLTGKVTLNAGDPSDPNTAADQQILAGGKLTASAAIAKTSKGQLLLQSAGDLSVGDVTTAHQGSALEITTTSAGASVTTGALDASGTTLNAGGNVTVTSSGSVDIARIDSHGSAGAAQTSAAGATDGRNGGEIRVTGANLTLGTVTSVAGSGGAALKNQPGTASGGNAGEITLTATAADGQIRLKGNVLADGGAGGKGTSPTTPTDPQNGPDGLDADVHLHGSVQLLASSDTTTTGADKINVIHGNVVAIDGAVRSGTQTGDPAAGLTGLTIVAENRLVDSNGAPSADGAPSAANGISIGGDITAGTVDLEVHHGNLALGDTGVTRVNADQIRLAATDGKGGTNTTGEVDLGTLAFAGSDGSSPVGSFTLEQDRAIGGANGSLIPDIDRFGDHATRTTAFSLALISQDDTVTVGADDLVNNLARLQPDADRPNTGLNLTLASNGPGPTPISVGGDIDVRSLTLGTATGVGGAVGGNASIAGTLRAGSPTAVEEGENALVASGNLDITGDAHLQGNVKLDGNQDQLLHTTGQLELTGQTVKTASGKLTITADGDIDFSSAESQAIGNTAGALEITNSLYKAKGDLLLSGVSADDTQAAVVVDGVRNLEYDPSVGTRRVAIFANDGSVSVTAATDTTSGSGSGVGTYAIHGDVVANGSVAMNGRGQLSDSAEGYRFVAGSGSSGVGGELTLGGMKSTDGKVTLLAAGPDATLDDPRPAAIHLKGEFDLSDALEVQDTVDVVDDTTIHAVGDVVFGALDENGALDSGTRIQGAKSLSVKSDKQVLLGDDVAMTGGTFAVGGDAGVRFVSALDTQSIEAGTISLGNGAAKAPNGRGSLLRDGGLVLRASQGDVAMAPGQRLIVNGGLNVGAARGVTLGDTAALGISVSSSDLSVYGGSTVEANSIVTSAAPHVAGGGNATFGVPTRNEVSSNVPSDDVLVRSLTPTGELLAFATPSEGQPFDPAFPIVSGAALFDFAREVPRPQPVHPLTRPHADPIDLQVAVRERPLWAEELLGYLEMRSLESPSQSGRPPEAEHLPPVGARPGDELEPSDARVRSAAVESAVAVYRDLFRGELHRDPESGVIDQPNQAAAIRAAFQAPVDVLRREHQGKAVAGSDVAALVERESRFDAARRYREQIGSLLSVAERALIPEQRSRFRALVLAEVTPYGISAAEFQSLF